MKEKIVDVSWRKDLKIVNKEREVAEYNKNHAILDIVSNVERPCGHMDPLGEDTVLDCLTCSNSDYKIMFRDKVIKDFKNASSNTEKDNKERYVIEFFDNIPTPDNIMTYLEDNNSNYRITRDSDRIILRQSLEDRKKVEEERIKLTRKIEEKMKVLELKKTHNKR